MIALTIVTCLSPHTLIAQNSLEIDLDGQLGNGPDTVHASISDTIDAAIWIVPTPGEFLWQFGVLLCETGDVLAFEEGIIEAVTEAEIVDIANGCPVLSGFHSFGWTPPFHAATSRYTATSNGTSLLSIDLEISGWDSDDLFPRPFDSAVGAVIQVGTTATETTQWGQVKELFR